MPVTFSDADARRLFEMLRWFDREKNLRNRYRRNRGGRVVIPTEIRRARTNAAVGGSSELTANLYDFEGTEQTTGDESNITVYALICQGSALNSSAPRIPDNQDIIVAKFPYTSTTDRWYLVGLLSGSVACD